MEIIRSDSRGHANHGWLNAKHSFSFADYYDPARMGFGPLRVINEDRIAGGKGFGSHPHKDMEIVTYLIDGALEHKDSMGNGSVIRAGDVQRMTAGTGVFHSEFNHSETDVAHLLQIWILPEKEALEPGYEQLHFSRQDKLNQWRLLGSADGREGSMTIHQDVKLFASVLESGQSLSYRLEGGRKGFLQLVSGELDLHGERLSAGDGVALDGEVELLLTSSSDSELMFFDMGP